jgi:molybdopterin-guanine dinucleotide biosynthesis protein A
MSEASTAASGCVGIVLAGGRSRRMGQDKAMLPFGTSTLLKHQLTTLAVLCDRVVVSGDYPGYDCVGDLFPDRGPLGGMHAIAKRFNQEALLFLPVDMPAMIPEVLTKLMTQSNPCHFDGQPLPCFFPIADDVAKSIESLWESDSLKKSVHDLHAFLSSRHMPSPAQNPFENINTLEHWQCFKTNR